MVMSGLHLQLLWRIVFSSDMSLEELVFFCWASQFAPGPQSDGREEGSWRVFTDTFLQDRWDLTAGRRALPVQLTETLRSFPVEAPPSLTPPSREETSSPGGESGRAWKPGLCWTQQFFLSLLTSTTTELRWSGLQKITSFSLMDLQSPKFWCWD